jgi:hypothetical protein
MWWYRLAAGVACAAVALFTLAGSALAGGWAVTTIDALPEGGFQAGPTYRLGYTIRQHGQHPFSGAKTSIRITSASTGESHMFPGVPDGPAGHYVAEVTFPSEGEWIWEVSQYPFAIQSLGTVTVAPFASAGPGSGVKESLTAPVALSVPFGSIGLLAGSLPWLPLALLSVLLLAIGLFMRPLSGLVRRLRGGTALPGPHVARASD